MKVKKIVSSILVILLVVVLPTIAGCSNITTEKKVIEKEVLDKTEIGNTEIGNTEISNTETGKTEISNTQTGNTETDNVITKNEVEILNQEIMTITIDMSRTRQTMESFGTSGAWWSQYVGGWDNNYKSGEETVREAIVRLLFDKETGIGLTSYRYNIGAGSADSGKGNYNDVHRRTQSFEISPGVYDWSKDKNAVWFMNKAVETGAEEVILFCNSPLERLTINGLAHLSEKGQVNILPENYDDFANYVLDVTEHFLGEGVPVKYVSPINEPQWDWTGAQEGCHYEPNEVVGVYQAFIKELNRRENLKGVELSGPESGEWKGDALRYTSAILNNTELSKYFTTIDCHSYWSNTSDKVSYKNWIKAHYPDVKLRMSEWCEMVNGSDFTMDSAFHLAQTLAEDLTVLDVVSWQNWVAVAPGGYRDGLIYVNEEKKTFTTLKRLWAYGNYSKFVRPGYVRLEIDKDSLAYRELKTVAFTGNNGIINELVIICINESNIAKYIQINNEIIKSEGFSHIACYETSDNYDLACTIDSDIKSDDVVKLNPKSITTIVMSK